MNSFIHCLFFPPECLVLLRQNSKQYIVHSASKMLLSPVLGEGNGTPLRYSCLENPMDGGAWWAAVHGVAKSRTRLSDFTVSFHFPALEEEMATHSSVLAWRIPGMGEAAVCGVAQSRTRLKWLSSTCPGNPQLSWISVIFCYFFCFCLGFQELKYFHRSLSYQVGKEFDRNCEISEYKCTCSRNTLSYLLIIKQVGV